jgi:hypothetical protein
MVALVIVWTQSIVVVGIGLVVDPVSIEAGHVTLSQACPTLVSTGSPCSTCGMTRGVCAFFHLRFSEAYAYNSMAPLFALLEGMIALVGALLLGRKIIHQRTQEA